MRRDKPAVSLRQHTRLAKATRVTDGGAGLLRHWWEEGSWGGGGAAAANLPPAGLLMPTICVCNSSPADQENTSKQTPGEMRSVATSLPGRRLMTDSRWHQDSRGTGADQLREMKSGGGAGGGLSSMALLVSAYLTAVLITEGVQAPLQSPPAHSEWMNQMQKKNAPVIKCSRWCLRFICLTRRHSNNC